MTAMLAIIAATPAGLAQLYPIRRPVAGAGILRPIHECLYQYRRNPVPDLPIPGQMPQCACQRGTRQIFYLYPGQQDKPAVIDKQRQAALENCRQPTIVGTGWLIETRYSRWAPNGTL